MIPSIHVSAGRARRLGRAAIAVALASFFSAASFGEVTLTWQDNSANETGFRIERALADLVFVPLATVGRDVTTYVDATALPATGYHYRVAAVNTSGQSAFSNVATSLGSILGNTAPTISNLADQSMIQGSASAPIGFSIGDAETSASALIVAATSSNPTLVPPLTGLALAGTGSARTITVTPAAGQLGSATITVTVSDGVLLASETFVLTVTSGNTAPTISAIAGRSINEDTSTGAIAFTVGDSQTAAGNLIVSATSSNVVLVPLSNIGLGGSGANRTVTISPAPNQSGSALITLAVSDGVLTTTTSFTLTVSAVNDPPALSVIASQATNEDTPVGPISFTVSDLESAGTALVVTGSSSNTLLVPNSAIVFGGSGTSRTVTITPAANQVGSAQITVAVSDGQASATRTFMLTVNPGNTAPTISNIGDQTIKKGSTTGALAFTISDAQTPAGNLTVTGTSSDVKIVPANAIVFGGSGGNRTVTVKPLANRVGTVTITVVVSDGTLTATDSFLVTVQAKIASSKAAESADEEGASESDRLQLSALGEVTDGSPLIGGFVVEGEVARTVLVRGVGPGLAQYGVVHPLAAPWLQIYDAAGELIHASGAWGGEATVAEAFVRTGRFPLATGSADAATILTLLPGTYTVHVTDGTGDGGTALLEILDAEGGRTPRVVAESARANIGPDRPLTAGLVVTGTETKTIVLRGIGPGLAQWGVSDALGQTRVAVYDRTGAELAQSREMAALRSAEEWREISAATAAVGRPPLRPDSLDSTLILTLEPGVYTINLGSGGDSSGSGLIEVLELRQPLDLAEPAER